MSSRRIPQQARSRAVYDAILEAAGQVLVERGYEKASTGRIAERAGVSVGSLYQYFGGKDDVFAALTARVIDAVGAAGTEAMTAPVSLQRRVVMGLRASFAVMGRQPGLLRHLSTLPGTAFSERSARIRSGFQAIVATVLEQHRGSMSMPDVQLGARLLVDATEGILLNLRPDDDPERLAEEGARLLLAYCGLEPEPTPAR